MRPVPASTPPKRRLDQLEARRTIKRVNDIPAKLILLRHAESEGNAGRVMQGAGEYPLSDLGRRQASEVRAALLETRPGLVAASDLGRAQETALLTLGRIDLIDSRLRERGAGPWEGRSRAELEAAYPGALEDDTLRPEGFEPTEQVVQRMKEACLELLSHRVPVLSFTHGAVMRLLDGYLGGTGDRFKHLEGLELLADPAARHGLRILGRRDFLQEARS